MSDTDNADNDGHVRRVDDSITRRPRDDRYFYSVPHAELPREWLVSVLGMIEVVLDMPGAISLQDVVDSLDYGPERMSPRQTKQFEQVFSAFHRSTEEQKQKCAQGDHRWKDGRCWGCKEYALKVVEDT